MHFLKPVCAAIVSLACASSSFGSITAGAVTETLRTGDTNNQGTAVTGSIAGDLFPLAATATQQSSYTDPTAGFNTSSEAQVTQAFTYSSDDAQAPFYPSGHNYDYSFSTYTLINVVGHISPLDSTIASVDIMTTFTLDTPTAWRLTEDASGGPDSMNTDLFFMGATLFAGNQFLGYNQSILPNLAVVYEDGGVASGVLSPGTYTYFVSTGGSGFTVEDLGTNSDFSLTELPEPIPGLPLFAASLVLVRRR